MGAEQRTGPGPEPILVTRGLTKTFPGTRALDDVSFDLRAGEVHALLGENGAGKSTLVKCLTGAYARDGGTIRLAGQEISPSSVAEAQALGIGTVYQEVNLLPNLTVAENLTLGRATTRFGLVRHRAMRREAEAMLEGYGLSIDVGRELGTYSVAVQQIVAIARAVALSGKVLILDEPTASLDAREVGMLFDVMRRMKASGLGVVFITHFLDQVFAVSDRMTVLRNGRNVGTLVTAATDRLSLVNLMLGRELAAEEAHAADRERAPGDVVLRAEGLGAEGVVAPFDLSLRAGSVTGLAGLLGSGRTETAEMIFGARTASKGRLSVNGRGGEIPFPSPREAIAAGLGFAPEDRKTDGIVADLSVRENISLALQARRGWAHPIPRAEQDRLAREWIDRLDIRTSGPEKPIGELSGGNQQKAILARWLAMQPKVLILDEPTRGIDVGAHAEILALIERIVAGGMSVLVVSSELDELTSLSDRVLVLRDRRHVAELTGERITSDAIVEAIAADHAGVAA